MQVSAPIAQQTAVGDFVRQEGKLADMKGWRSFYRMAIGEVGFVRKMVRPWFDYFRPDFHPWDEDNSRFLEGIERFSAPYARRPTALAAALLRLVQLRSL